MNTHEKLVELVATALQEAFRQVLHQLADHAVTALESVGLLLAPAGGQIRREWMVTYLAPQGRVNWTYPTEDYERAVGQLGVAEAEGGWPGLRLERRTVTTWPDGSVLLTPWDEVFEEQP